MPAQENERRTVYFSGRVQGVGFRYTAAQIAQRFAVQGFVQNLPDRRVLLVAEGTPAEVAGLVQAIEERMAGFIEQRTVDRGPATGEFDSFEIRT